MTKTVPDNKKIIDLDWMTNQFGFDKNTAFQMLEMFVDSLSESVINIEKTFQDNDYAKLKFEVHRLHGAAIYCGVLPLKNALAELEISLINKKNKDEINERYMLAMSEIKNFSKEYELSFKK